MEKLRTLFVIAGGVIYLLFGIFHNIFWQFFSKAQQVNPALVKITQMLNLGCMVFFCALGFVFLRYRKEILTTRLGNALLILSAVFFIIRLGAEFFFNAAGQILHAMVHQIAHGRGRVAGGFGDLRVTPAALELEAQHFALGLGQGDEGFFQSQGDFRRCGG